MLGMLSEPTDPQRMPYSFIFALHPVFMHLENKTSYIRVLFVDSSSAFNAFSPMKLIGKLEQYSATGFLASRLRVWLSPQRAINTPFSKTDEAQRTFF